jgi:hypothetical protein
VGGQTSYYPAKFSRFIVSYTPSAIMTANIDDPVAPDGTTWDQHVIDKTKLKLEEAVRQTILSPRAGGVGVSEGYQSGQLSNPKYRASTGSLARISAAMTGSTMQ